MKEVKISLVRSTFLEDLPEKTPFTITPYPLKTFLKFLLFYVFKSINHEH